MTDKCNVEILDADLDSKEAEERSRHDDRLILPPERERTTHAPHMHNKVLGGLKITEAQERSTATPCMMTDQLSQSEEELPMLLTATAECWEV